ncbi:metal-dependent hydrolase [Haloterrigena salifodinae]|uniref:Metal-dependent hydrolase n=1 Tax=Haloterrigena salifodinae TaxID=2675099 RepID=A0A8T8E056_9EURY|nr:metal-dependent hydrolase [Haloterrigena salifodinae]QRV15175.1 metal-dependent hydrolase [Haloterrigena salifodinae]
MWPWEHAIVAYLAYSTFCHAIYRDSPSGLEAIAVVFASVFPDLVDKLLAWEFGVFDAGYALGHSVFAAVPISIGIGLAARSIDRSRVGIAFALGYLLHLPADVFDSYVREGIFQPELMLWPVVVVQDHSVNQGFVEQFLLFFSRYRDELLTGDLTTYRWLQIGLAVFTALLWLYDGAPVLRNLLRGSRRLLLGVIGNRRFDESTGRR